MEYAYRTPAPEAPLRITLPELGPAAVFGQYAESDTRRRLLGVGTVILLHALLIWGLASGLARQVVELLPSPIETRIIEEHVKPDEAPPPPELEAPPPPFIPPPQITIAEQAPRPTAITTVTEVPPPPAPAPVIAPPAPRQVVRVAPEVKARHCAEPEYPSISERLGETGTVQLALLVGTDGKVKESRVESSSGHERLDKAALSGLTRCRFTPGTADGVPEPAWAQIRYTFRGAP